MSWDGSFSNFLLGNHLPFDMIYRKDVTPVDLMNTHLRLFINLRKFGLFLKRFYRSDCKFLNNFFGFFSSVASNILTYAFLIQIWSLAFDFPKNRTLFIKSIDF